MSAREGYAGAREGVLLVPVHNGWNSEPSWAIEFRSTGYRAVDEVYVSRDEARNEAERLGFRVWS